MISVLGGLAPDSNEPMSAQMQEYLQQTWRGIAQKIPGTRFNYDFWTECQPRRSTYPACRAVTAARSQDGKFEDPMISTIQQGYYLQAKNPSDDETLLGFAESIGLDKQRFMNDLNAPSTHQSLEQEMNFGRSMGVQGFPSLILAQQGKICPIRVEFLNVDLMVESVKVALEVG